MTPVIQKTSVYLNWGDQPLNKATAPQKIGRIWTHIAGQIKMKGSQKTISNLMAQLGVKQTDQDAFRELLPVIVKALNPKVEIRPDPDSTGVYYLTLGGKTFGVFKAGEKRARMELLVRQIAHKAGLQGNCVPGIFCTIANPIFPEGDTFIDLWNGSQKIYENNGDYNQTVDDDNFGVAQSYTLTGILEPFITPERETTADDFARITCLALLVGLRDGKEDGIAGSKMFDMEECMPPRLDPSENPDEKVAATHLPFLQNEFAKQPIRKEILQELERKVSSMRNSLNELSKEKVEFFDLNAESFNVSDSNTGWDHGGCWVTVDHSKSGLEDCREVKEFDPKDPDSFKLLSDNQLNSFDIRINRLADFLSHNKSVTCIEMSRAIDPLFDAHVRALEEKQDRHSPFKIAGQFSPRGSFSKLSKEDLRAILAASIPYSRLQRSSSAPVEMQSSSMSSMPNKR